MSVTLAVRLVDFVCGFGSDLCLACGCVLTSVCVCAHMSVTLAVRLVDFVCGFGSDLCLACGCVLTSVCVCVPTCQPHLP